METRADEQQNLMVLGGKPKEERKEFEEKEKEQEWEEEIEGRVTEEETERSSRFLRHPYEPRITRKPDHSRVFSECVWGVNELALRHFVVRHDIVKLGRVCLLA